MSTYRKRPIEIEAMKFDVVDFDYACEVVRWCGGKAVDEGIALDTLEGRLVVQPGDYVVRGVQGEFYPVKPAIFEATYEPVSEEPG